MSPDLGTLLSEIGTWITNNFHPILNVLLTVLLVLTSLRETKILESSRKPKIHISRLKPFEIDPEKSLVLEISNHGEGPARNLRLEADLDSTTDTLLETESLGVDLMLKDVADNENWYGVVETNLPAQKEKEQFVARISVQFIDQEHPKDIDDWLTSTDHSDACRLQLSVTFEDERGSELEPKQILDYVIFPDEADTLREALETGRDFSAYERNEVGAKVDVAIDSMVESDDSGEVSGSKI